MFKFLTILSAVVTFIGLILILMSMVTIEQTERGVITRFGEVRGVLEPGFHVINPFTTDVHKIDVSVQALSLDELVYSKDGQIVAAQYVVNYQVDSSMVESLFREVRRDHEARYVIPQSRESLKEIFSKYTAQGIIDNRAVLTGEVRLRLEESIGGNGIRVQNVVLENLDFDDAYEAAIQEKQVEEQRALAQINITKQEEEKKKQEILKAEALSEKTRLEAEALASQQGEKVIEKIKAEAQLEAARRWNGQLPTNMYGSAPIPLINI